MSIREIIKFAVDDGSEFDTRAEAERYLARAALADHMRVNLVLHDIGVDRLARWLMENYNITPREPDANP